MIDLITYALCKKQIQDALSGAGAIKGEKGESAYEIAIANGYAGTVDEWVESLKGRDGITPSIGENGNWFVGEVDTGVCASGIKITTENESSELKVDEENGIISAVKDGEEIVVATTTKIITNEQIQELFMEEGNNG